jgi:hypothetical protein
VDTLAVDTLNAVNTPGVGTHWKLDRAYLEKQIPISHRIAPAFELPGGHVDLRGVAHTNVVWAFGPQGGPGSGPGCERHAVQMSTINCATQSCLLQRPTGSGPFISGDFFLPGSVVTCPTGDLCWMPRPTSLAQLCGAGAACLIGGGQPLGCGTVFELQEWSEDFSGSKSKPSRRREGSDFSSA